MRSREAIDHLEKAVELDPSTRAWAAEDGDLNAIRSDPRFSRITVDPASTGAGEDESGARAESTD